MLLLIFQGGQFQEPTPPPAGLVDFSMVAATAIGGLGGTPGIGDVAGGVPRNRGGSGQPRIR